MAKIKPAIFVDAKGRPHVENVSHCPWCGRPGTRGEFCDFECLRAYWRDLCSEFGRVDPRVTNDREASCAP